MKSSGGGWSWSGIPGASPGVLHKPVVGASEGLRVGSSPRACRGLRMCPTGLRFGIPLQPTFSPFYFVPLTYHLIVQGRGYMRLEGIFQTC